MTPATVINFPADLDAITRLPVRNYFFSRGKKELDFARRFDIDVAVIVIQLDGFDEAMTRYGAPVAKQFLRKLARYIGEAAGEEDTVTRLGTSCFAIVAESIGAFHLKDSAEKIIRRVRNTRYLYNDEHLSFTVSIGMAMVHGDSVDTFEDVLEVAARRMRRASAAGGDRIAT